MYEARGGLTMKVQGSLAAQALSKTFSLILFEILYPFS